MRVRRSHRIPAPAVPFRLWAPARFRSAVSFVVAAALTPIVVLVPATPAHAAPGEIIIEADIEDAEDGTFTFEIRRIGPTIGMGAATVHYDTVTAPDSTFAGATPGVDFTLPATTSSTFAESTRDVIKRVTVHGITDPNDEYDERFALRLFAADNTPITEAWGTMLDNDDPPTYSVAPITVDESATTATVTATLSNFSAKPVSIPYRTVDDTATAGEDYTAKDGMLDFTVGQATATVGVTLLPDDRDEGASEKFKLDTTGTGNTATNATPSLTATDLTADVTITDDDAPSVISIGNAPSVREGDTLRFPVTLDKASNLAITANANTGGTATAGDDYTALTNEPVTIAPGDTTATVSVPTVSDSDNAETENVTVTLSGQTNADLGTATGTGSIVDSLVTVTPVETIDETEHVQHFDITLSHAATGSIQIDYAVAAGTASSPADFTASSDTLTFTPGQVTKRIAVPIHADTTHEAGGETFTITLTNPGDGVTGGLGTSTFTILDDDTLPTLSTMTTSIARPEDDSDNTATFVAGISNASNQPITLNISSADTTDITEGGSALGKNDYDIPSTVTIPAGSTSVNIPVTVHGDEVYETDETATITATVPGGETDAASGNLSGTLTLQNDDDIPVITFSSVTRDEGLSAVPIVASVTGTAEATIPYIVSTGAGASDGTAGIDDFDPANLVSGDIDPGEVSLALGTVEVKADTVDDDSDDFTITIAPTSVVAPKTATVTITDQATDLPPRVVGSNALTVGEEEVSIDVPVTLDFAGVTGNTATSTDKTITVNYATSDGTATAGTDYTTTNTPPLSFVAPDNADPASITQNITVPILDDSAFEVDENFSVALTSASTVVNGTTAVTIEDEPDPKPTFGVTANHAMAETGTATFTVTLSEPASAATDFDVTVTGGTATEAVAGIGSDDYDAPSGTVTIPKDHTTAAITFAVKPDDVYEGNETVDITIEPDATADNIQTATLNRTLTITDGESVPVITLDNVATTAPEGGQLMIRATPSIATEVALTYNVSLAGDATQSDPAEPEDFTEGNVLTETIPASSAAGVPVTLQTVDLEDDQADEYTEQIKATVTNVAPTGPDPVEGFYKIVDDEFDMTPEITKAGTVNVNESDANATVPVTLSWAGLPNTNDADSTQKTLTVDYATADDTATAGEDYTADSDTLTFPADDQTPQDIEVPLLNDTDYELAEQFKVNLSGVVGDEAGDSLIADPETLVVIADNDSGNKPTYSVVAPADPVDEGGSGEFTVNLTAKAVADITFDVTLAAGGVLPSAVGGDYSLPSATVTVEEGFDTATFTVDAEDDDLYEEQETATVVVTPASLDHVQAGGELDGGEHGPLTITDTDVVPTVAFDPVTDAVEGDTLTVVGRPSGMAERPMDYTVVIAGDGTHPATDTDDFTATPVTVTIPGSTPADTAIDFLEVDLEGDQADEYAETFKVTATNDTYTSADPVEQTYAIGDDENDMTPEITTAGPVNVGEGDGDATIPVSLSWAGLSGSNDATSTEKTITVAYTTADDTAKQPDDYTLTAANTLTFPADTTPQDVLVPIEDDSDFEATEQFKFNLTNASDDVVIADPETVVAIADNDSGNKPGYSVVAPGTPAGEGGSVEYTVNLDSGALAVGDITFDVTVVDGAALPYASGADYSLQTTTVTVHEGDGTATFTVDVTDDDLYEGTETATVVVKPASLDYVQAGDESDGGEHGALTIADAEAIPTITLEPVLDAEEGDTLTVVAKPSGKAERDMDYTVVIAGTGNNPATVTDDFTATPVPVTILGSTPAGTGVDFLEVDLATDKADEYAETFKVTATNTTYTSADPVEQTYAIADDANDLTPRLVAGGPQTVGESTPTVDVPVSLSWAGLPNTNDATSTQKTITVDWATEDGTAINPGDYVTAWDTMTFTPGDPLSQNAQVTIASDTVYEADETFKVKLSAPTPAGDSTIGTAESVITIDDDDDVNKPTYSVTTTSVAEGASAEVTVTLTKPAVSDITFDVSVGTVGASAPTAGVDDYDVTDTTITVLKGDSTGTGDIALENDTLYEGTENATVIVKAATGETDVKPGTQTGDVEYGALTIADTDTVPTITLNTVTNGAEGGTIDVIATPDGVAERDMVYALTLAGAGTDPAESGDFTDSAATATITGGSPANTPVTLRSIPVASDLVDENDETIGVTVHNNTHTTGDVSSTYTIADAANNKSPNVVATTPTAVNENAGTAVVPVALSFTGISGNVATSTEKTIEVDFATVEGTAKEVTDYSPLDDSLTFSPWDTTQYITVPLIGDDAYELTEQFTVHLDNPTGDATVTTPDTVVEITDTDPKPTFTITPSRTATEGQTASYTVTLGSPAADDVTLEASIIDVTTTDGGSGPGKDDYTAPTNPITILKGQTTATVSVPVTDDTAYEGQETATVRVSLGTGESEAIGGPADGTLTITDNDAVPTIALTSVEGAEGAPLSVVARPTGVAERAMSYTLTAAGDATAGNDPAEPADWTNNLTTGTVPAGTASNTALDFGSIPLLADTVDEPVETVKVTAHNSTVTTPDVSALYRITDDPLDKAPSAALGSTSVTEAGGPAQVPVTLTFDSANGATSTERPISITYQVLAGNTTASDRGNPTTANPLVFAPGTTSDVIRIPIIDDVEDESDETFRVKATAVNPSDVTFTADTASVVIIDNDDPVTPTNPGGPSTPGGTPSFSVGDVTVSESATNATFTVTLSSAAPGDVDLAVAIKDGTASDATTGPGGDDYDAPPNSLVIAKGARTGQITVPLHPDQVYEGEETAQLTVALAGGETDATGAAKQVNLTITDDDARPTVAVQPVTVAEGENVTVSGTVTGVAQRELTITAPTVTAGGGGGDPLEENEFDYAGDDAVVPAGTASGSTVELGTIQFSDDTVDEDTETLSVNFAQSGTATRSQAPVVFKITDDPDDVAPTVSITDADTAESAGTVELEVSLEFTGDTTGTERTVTVPWRTIAGTAKAGEDFTASSGTVTITPPAGSATVSVPLLTDDQKETEQTFSVFLSGAKPSDVTITKPKGIVTIDDDDKAKTPTLSAPGTVTGSGRIAITGRAGAGSTVQLLSAPGTSGGEFKVVLTVVADRDGKFSFNPNFTAGYRLMVKADNLTSAVRTVQLRQDPTITVASNARGAATVTVTGDPARGGQDVRVQQLVGRRWETVATGELNKNGKFTTTERNLRAGNHSFRAVVAATPSLGILAGTSPAKQIRVR